MHKTKAYLTYGAIAFTVASFLMGYLVKPRANTRDIVPLNYQGKPQPFQGAALANRIAMSYNLALILTRSQFSSSDATALEAIRNWASKNFARDPNFLHPVSVEDDPSASQSIIDSYVHSMMASIRFAFEALMADYLSWRIQDYQNTDSFKFFCLNYFGTFGSDIEARQLLASYQSSRAREAIDPMVIATVWSILISFAIWYLAFSRRSSFSQRIQSILAAGWLTLALFYTLSAWNQNQVSILVSAIISGIIGLYFLRPVTVVHGENKGMTIQLVNFSTPVLALFAWLSVSLLIIRVICWIKTGSALHPDPITLIISGLRGDFLHDPVHVKRNIDRILGLLWLAFTLWLLPNFSGEWTAEAAQEEPLRAIQKPLY